MIRMPRHHQHHQLNFIISSRLVREASTRQSVPVQVFQMFRVIQAQWKPLKRSQIVFIFRLIFSAVPVLSRRVQLRGVPAKVGAGHRRRGVRIAPAPWENQSLRFKRAEDMLLDTSTSTVPSFPFPSNISQACILYVYIYIYV